MKTEWNMGVVIALGVGIGTALGVVFDNIPIGVALGAGFGAAIGAIIESQKKKNEDKENQDEV